MDSGVVTGNACNGVGLELKDDGEYPSKSTALSFPTDPMSMNERCYLTATIDILNENTEK